ncbi:MAG: threonine--tRNA ligase [bacterium]
MNNEKLEIIRHSASHVLMQALTRLYGAVPGVGPAIENGFYHDIDAEYQITLEDFPKIESEMNKIIKENLEIKKKVMPIDEGIKFLKDKNYVYTAELAEDLKAQGETEVSFYEQGDFINMCKGPHIASTGELNPDAFKLTKLAGAYWKGDEKNKMLQRIYGVAFESKEKMDKYLEMLKEAEKRDHRKLGQELGLFMLDEEVGQGLPLWLPKGAILRREIENFVLNEYIKRGYQQVYTPHIGSEKLFNISGHLDFYKDGMYSPLEIEDEMYYLKPMNCPMHVKIYKHESHSYRDLPIRYTELGTVYRYERSGTLHGLTRVRGFTQDDAHIICSQDQLQSELSGALDLMNYVLTTFGFENFRVALSVRDSKNKTKYLGTDEEWNLAEGSLIKSLDEIGWSYVKEEGEAVFYGPKIDVKVTDAIGREWQISTLQVDFNLPEKFDMNYIDSNSEKKRPFMLHRALLGSVERFTGVLIEHYTGAFPLWLSPVQVKILPVSDKFIDYANSIVAKLREKNIRVEVDGRSESLGKKIRESEMQKIPYMVVVGEKEQTANKVRPRHRKEGDIGELEIEKFIEKLEEEIASKGLA